MLFRSKMDQYGVHINNDGYDWRFTADYGGTLYTPGSAQISMTGYWNIGDTAGTVGYPLIGATNYVDSNPYDVYVQTQNNYFYFRRDGSFELPPSGDIIVDGFWAVGNGYAKIEAYDQVDADPYDIRITADGYYWYFRQDGKLEIPTGGDIVDGDGASVIGKDMKQQVTEDSNYTLQLTDRGGHVYVNYSGLTVYVPTNASVAFPIDRKSTRLNSSHTDISRMPSFA